MQIILQMWRYVACLSLLILCPSVINSEKKLNKYVTTLLDAKWKETPVIAEVAEYLNNENTNYFWRFVEEVSDQSNSKLNADCNYDQCFFF